MKDKYDEAIEFLTQCPEKIYDAWNFPPKYEAGCLFEKAGRSDCGCLTQITGHNCYVAATPELTELIRADERIPKEGRGITVENLYVFAEWQRKIDKILVRY